MALIEFRDLPDTTTPLTANNLNNNFNECYNIVESGENANGRYIKYSDGTMICYREVDFSANINISWGSLYYGLNDTEWNFANEFIEVPEVLLDIKASSSIGLFAVSYQEPTITKTYYKGIYVVRPSSVLSVPIKATILAIGKWK